MPARITRTMVGRRMSAHTVVLFFGSRNVWKVLLLWHNEKSCIIFVVKEEKLISNRTKKPPKVLAKLLRFDGDARSNRFLRQIRSYNSLFAFTSLGANIDRTINNGTAPYVFKINGVVHHRIGTLMPRHGTRPKFAQLYIYMPLSMKHRTD
jgi:hypothetical protein